MIQEANLHWQYKDTECNLVMPWYTLPTLQWLKEQPTKNWNVFEYGAGYSTIWWRANAKSIDSIESLESWALAVSARSLESEGGKMQNYVEAIKMIEDGYDAIIVDGLWREECVAYCMYFLKKGGVLIIDNYDSEDHDPKRTEELLKDWTKVVHKQPNHSTWQTAVFTKP